MEIISDEQLVGRYLRGDDASFEALTKRYLPHIYGFARQYAGNSDKASDIAQETFLKAWRNLKKFDRKRSFRAWIFTIAKNTALDWLKRREETPFSQLDSEAEEKFLNSISDQNKSLLAALDDKERAAGAAKLIERLPEQYRTVVSLRHENDLTFKEIARRLKAPLNTVKSRYRRALLSLKDYAARSNLEF